MKRLAAMVVLGLVIGVPFMAPAHAGGGGSAASSPTGHALAGKIQRLKLEAAKAESEALAAKDAVLRQAVIEVRIISIATKILGMGVKPLAGVPVSQTDVALLAHDIAQLANEFGD
jgi:hypothetical protein